MIILQNVVYSIILNTIESLSPNSSQSLTVMTLSYNQSAFSTQTPELMVTTEFNASAMNQSERQDYCGRHLEWLGLASIQFVFVFGYLVVLCLSVSGNVLVIYVIATNKAMRSVTNLFILNLACSDLLQATTSCWLTPLYLYMGHWVFGSVPCHLLPMAQGTSIFVSTLTLTGIAIDRYLVILHPHRTRMSSKECSAIITTIWTLSVLLVAPYAVHMQHVYIDPCEFHICREHWSFDGLRKMYGSVVMVLQFVVPLLIVAVCYTLIGCFLSHRRSLVSGPGRRMSELELSRRRKAHKMLVSMVILFVISWLPTNILNVLRDLHLSYFLQSYFMACFLGAHLMAMSATCWNPLLYAWMNESFRTEFKATLPCFTNRQRVRRGSTTNCREQSALLSRIGSMRRRASVNRRRSILLSPKHTDTDKQTYNTDIQLTGKSGTEHNLITAAINANNNGHSNYVKASQNGTMVNGVEHDEAIEMAVVTNQSTHLH